MLDDEIDRILPLAETNDLNISCRLFRCSDLFFA